MRGEKFFVQMSFPQPLGGSENGWRAQAKSKSFGYRKWRFDKKELFCRKFSGKGNTFSGDV